MSGGILTAAIIAMIAALCGWNYRVGYRWTQLDHNPWSGRFLGGSFSGNVPGWNPGAMDLGEIHKRGRRMMVAAPIVFVVALIFVIFVFGRGRVGA